MRRQLGQSPRAHRGGTSIIELFLFIAIILVLFTMGFTGFAQFQSMRARMEAAHWKQARRLGEAAPRQLSPIRVLFVGNSMTYYHRMPEMTRALAAHAGDNGGLMIDSRVVGGETLQQHWNEGVALEKIQQGGWDFVVLQEQGLREVHIESDGLVKIGKLFADEVHRGDAFPVQFLPWVRPNDTALLAKVIELHVSTAKRNKAEIAPVGLAWQKAYSAKAGLPLCEQDGHPTAMGSYLAACVFYATFFDKSPVGLPGRIDVEGETIVNLSESDTHILQTAAWDAVNEIRKQAPRGGSLFR